MLLTILITISLLVIVLTLALKSRHNFTRFSLILTVGMILSDTIILIYLNSICYQPEENVPWIIAFFDSLQIGTLNAGFYDKFVTLKKIGFAPLTALFYITSLMTPFCFMGLALSFFSSISGRIKYIFFARFTDVYYFSEITEEAFELAKNISNHEPKALIVFIDTESDADDTLISLAIKYGFIVSKKTLMDYTKTSKRKRYYFVLGKNEKLNLHIAGSLNSKLITEKTSAEYSNVKIYLNCSLSMGQMFMDSRRNEEKQISVIFINKPESDANDLLFNHPLYESIKNSPEKKLHILIIGCGTTGDRILKLCTSLMQMGDKIKSRITVVDQDAFKYKSSLQLECPEIVENYAIDFYQEDINSFNFEHLLEEKCIDVNYIAVCLSSDDDNLRCGMYLRSFYLQKNPLNQDIPFIGIKISDSKTNKKISILRGGKQNYNLSAFGSNDNIYSYDLLINNELEEIAINIHAAYQYEEGLKLTYSKIIKTFNESESDRKSNRANAAHVKYKLYSLGYGIKKLQFATKDELELSPQLVSELSEKLKDETILDNLSRIEHDRWNAHERSDGWRTVTIEKSKEYASKIGSHKNVCAKLHPCLCTWDELDALGEAYGKDFKFYDTKIVKAIPEILGLTKETTINVCNISYILYKIS